VNNGPIFLVTHGGDLESVRREFETSTVDELVERYARSRQAVLAFERKYGLRAMRTCCVCRSRVPASGMRVDGAGSITRWCLKCEPQIRIPGKASHRTEMMRQYTDVPEIVYKAARSPWGRFEGDPLPTGYWVQKSAGIASPASREA
jgi:hypothetical protein